MSNRTDERDIYYVPPNFLTSGRLFGGAVRIRNAIEACILVVLTGLPIIRLPLSLTTRIIILCLIPLPLGIFGIIGIEGDALSEFLISWVRWLKKRRVLRRTDVSPAPDEHKSKVKKLRHQPPEKLGITLKPPEQKPKSSKTNSKSLRTLRSKKDLSTEGLIPVKDIHNGIVHLTDGRYIKILEVEPIRIRTAPLRTLAKSSSFLASVLASWMKAISSLGTPLRMSLRLRS